MKKIRDKSQFYFDLNKSNKPNKKRAKLKNNTNINKNISSEINLKITNRGVDKKKALEDMQNQILSSDLKKLHKFKIDQVEKFLKDKYEA